MGNPDCSVALQHELVQRRQRELQLPGRVQECGRLLGACAAGLQQSRLSEYADARRLLQQPDSHEEGGAGCAGRPELDARARTSSSSAFYFGEGHRSTGRRSYGYPQGMYSFNPATRSTSTTAIRRGRSRTRSSSPARTRRSTGTSRLSGAAYLGSCINPVAMMYLGTPDSFPQTNFTPDRGHALQHAGRFCERSVEDSRQGVP